MPLRDNDPITLADVNAFIRRVLISPNEATTRRILGAAGIITNSDSIAEGTTNLYFSNARVDAAAHKATATGTDTLTATFSPAPTLADFLQVSLRAAAANTGAVTLDANATGAIAVTKVGGTALSAGDIAAAGHELILRYRSSVPRWELLNPAASSASGQAAIQFEDEGANLGTSGTATEVDFVGAGVTATRATNKITVTIPGGSSGGAVLVVVDSTTARTAALTDENTIIEFSNAAAITYTIPPQATVAWPAGAILYALQGTTGQVTFAPGAGVTFETSDTYKTRVQESIIGMKRTASNKWEALGDLEAVLAALSVLGRSANSVGAPAAIVASADGQVLLRTSSTLAFGTIGASSITAASITYASLQNISATARVLGRKTAGAGVTEECTLSEILDFVGSAAQGDILYRNATGWVRLGAGIAGYVFTTGGAGANPSWAAGGGGGGGSGTSLSHYWEYLSRGSSGQNLTVGNRTLAAPASGWYLVRGNQRLPTTAFYFEVYIDSAGAGDIIIGIASAKNSATTFLGNDTEGYGVYASTGEKSNSGSIVAYGAVASTTGDIIGCAVDPVNGKIWWAKNNTWMAGGNPAAGTGAAYTTISATLGYFLAMSTYGASTTTLRPKASQQTYSPPSGFAAVEA